MVRAKTGSNALTHGFVRPSEPVLDRVRLLSADEAKATLAAKGWTNRALAQWWGCREEYVSKIIHNPKRKRHFDDALRGLPHIAEVRSERSGIN